jgi:hypothetical protein
MYGWFPSTMPGVSWNFPGDYGDLIIAFPKLLPDVDIDDNDGNLAANTMTLIGPPGAVVVGEFNLICPTELAGGLSCPNVDYFDGPSECNVAGLSFNFSPTLVSVGGGHSFDPDFYSVQNAEDPQDPLDELEECISKRIVLQVGIPHPTTPNKLYEGTVSADGSGPRWDPNIPGLVDADAFTLRVDVVPPGKGTFSGFWGSPYPDGNLIRWNGLSLRQEGYNVYRVEDGSLAKLNGSVLSENSYLDSEVVEGNVYSYKLGLPLGNGKEILLGPVFVSRRMRPSVHALYQNFPNPMGDETVIRYAVASDAKVSLKVYNIAGQTVKTLVDTHKAPGFYSVSWKPEDTANGVYFYRLTAGDFSQTRKMVVLK